MIYQVCIPNAPFFNLRTPGSITAPRSYNKPLIRETVITRSSPKCVNNDLRHSREMDEPCKQNRNRKKEKT